VLEALALIGLGYLVSKKKQEQAGQIQGIGETEALDEILAKVEPITKKSWEDLKNLRYDEKMDLIRRIDYLLHELRKKYPVLLNEIEKVNNAYNSLKVYCR